MSVKIDQKLAKAYIAAAGICAVVVTTKSENHISRITVRNIIDFSSMQQQQHLRNGNINRILWCRDRTAADRLARLTIEELIARQESGRGRRVVMPPDELFALVQEIAVRCGEPVTSHERVVARAMAIVDQVNAAYAPYSPQVRMLNRRYRAHRIAEESRGRKAPNYGEWLAEHKAGMLKSLAMASPHK